MPFKKGQSGNPDGKKPGTPGGGRPPEWLKQKCQQICDDADVLGFLRDVVKGKDFEQGVGQDGEVLKFPASVKDRVKAGEILLDRGFGKVAQPVEHSGQIKTETEEEKKARRAAIVAFLQEQTK